LAQHRGAAVLFFEVYWLDVDGEPVGPGYVYVRGGVVEAVEPGEPPEEMQYAEMVAGGPGRLVLPGLLLGPVVPETYVLRGLVGPGDALGLLRGEGWAAEAVASMSGAEAYHAALMMFYEAAVEGYTAVVAVTPHPIEVARALDAAGLWGLVLAPRGCGALDAEPPAGDALPGEARVSIGVLDCTPRPGPGAFRLTGEGLIEAPGGDRFEPPPWRGRGAPAPVTAAAASPWPMFSGLTHPEPREAYRWLAWRGYRLLPGHEAYEPLRGPASLVVLDYSEPPGWLPEPAGVEALGPARPRVETVMSRGRMVVDGEEHLYLGRSAAEEAARTLRGLRGRLARKNA